MRSTHLFPFRSLPQLVDELPDGHEDGEHQARGQHDEDASQVLDAHGSGLIASLLLAVVPVPPLLLQHVQTPILHDAQDGDAHFVTVR